MFGFAGPPVAIDQYLIPEQSGAGYANTSGRTSATAAITGGEKTLLIFAAGQSRITNALTATPYTPTNAAKVQQINVYEASAVYRLIDPVLGASGSMGSYLGKLGDALINGGVCARVIFVPIGIGNTSTAQWVTGDLRMRALVAGRRARALGYAVPNADLFPCIIWENGQTDVQQGVTSQQYQDNIRTIQGFFAEVGFPVPFFIAQSTMGGPGANLTDPTIRAAQAACVDNTALRYAGPDLDSLTGPTNLTDGAHFTDAGNTAAAALWKTAIDAVF